MSRIKLAEHVELNGVVLCEDAREEINNKYTLTGVFAGENIIVSEYPASIRLAAYFDFVFTRKNLAITSKIKILLDKKLLMTAEAEIAAPGGEERGHIVLLLPSFSLTVPNTGLLEFTMQIADGKWHTVERRKMIVGEIPSLKKA